MLSMILDFHMCTPMHETRVFLFASVSIDKRDKHKDNLTSKPDFLRHYYKIDVEDNKRVEDYTDEDKAEEEGLFEENVDDKGSELDKPNETESMKRKHLIC
jgi:hypothetical protein